MIPFPASSSMLSSTGSLPALPKISFQYVDHLLSYLAFADDLVGKNTISHQKVTISHQISRTKLLRFRTKFHYDFAPKNYDFAPNLPDQIIMISHQIYNDFAPNLLRFRTKFNMILHKLPSNFPLFWVRLGKSWAPSGRESFPQG